MKFKGVGFDYGGVIFGRPNHVFDEKISDLLNITVAEFRSSYYKFNKLYNKDLVSREDMWRMILKDLGKGSKEDEVFKFLRELPKGEINTKMLDLVDKLRQSGLKTGLFSNYTKEAAAEMRRNGIDKYFDIFLVSAEVGHVKPSVEAFTLLAEKMGILPTELVFIDDTEMSLSSSDKVGFHPILFRDYDSLINELTALSVLK